MTAKKGRKEGADMNAHLDYDREQLKEKGIVSENCNCSVYSMITVVAGVLLAAGAVVYSLFAM